MTNLSPGQFEEIIDNSSGAIFVKDSEFRYLFVNRRYEEVFHHSKHDVIGKTDYDLFPSQVADRLRANDKSVFAHGVPAEWEVLIPQEDGLHTFVTSKFPLRNPEGIATAICGIARDITQHKQAEQALRESQQRLWAIVQGSPIPQFVLGQDHKVISWNMALEKYTGISEKSVVGTSEHWRAFYPAPRPSLADLVIDEREEPIAYWYAGKYRSSDLVAGAYEATDFFPAMGEHGKWLHFTAAAIRGADGKIIGAVETLADITEQKLAEEATRAARQQLLDIIEFLPDATFVVNQEKKVIAWNRAIEEMTGVRKEDIIGQGDFAYALPLYGERRPLLMDLVGSTDSDLRSKYENFCVKGNTLYAEAFVPLCGGRGAYLGAVASPLLDREGNQVGAIQSIRDLTERKRAEEDLLKMQEQLRQAAKMEAIGRLAGGIAHDFNNQLTIVQGYCNLLLNGLSQGSSESELVREILRAAERSAQLTSQLLAFGRKQMLHPEVLDLNEVLEKLRDPLARMIGEDIHLEVQVAPDVWKLEIDRNQLEQVIINLAINARDAMPGGGRLTIEAGNAVVDSTYVLRHMDASEGHYVRLRVRDTGAGMDEPTRRKIFEPFFTTKPVGEGTGLGLAMVYGFVKQSGGHVDVLSEPGHGTCFNIYFPRSKAALVAEPVAPVAPPPTGNETILVIEDEDALRELMSHILKTCGYKVLQAADGASAIALNRQYAANIDLVLCDVIMPGLAGPDVVKQIKQDRPAVKILYVTGYAERSVIEGETRLLSKPFAPDTLFRIVRQVLDEDMMMCA